MKSRIFVNGALIGTHDNPLEFVENIREKRRQGIVSNQINIAYHKLTNEVIINTDMGRARRPLIIVKNGKPLITNEEIEQVRKGEASFDDMVKRASSSTSTPRKRRTLSSPSTSPSSPGTTRTWNSTRRSSWASPPA